MLEPIIDSDYKSKQGIPSCSPIYRYCSKCGSINKIKIFLGPYNSVNGERGLMIQHKCPRYNKILGRKHTHYVGGPWDVQDILNVVGRDISFSTYKKLAYGKEVFAYVSE